MKRFSLQEYIEKIKKMLCKELDEYASRFNNDNKNI